MPIWEKRDSDSPKVNQQVEERSYLVFEFPSGPNDQNDTPPTRHVLNFAENIEIIETQKSKLSPLKPIGRNGDVYVHTGAESRSLTIKFNMTLPNLIQHGYYKDKAEYKGLTKGKLKEAWEILATPFSTDTSFEDKINSYDAAFLGELSDQERRNNPMYIQYAIGRQGSPDRSKAISQIAFWTNLIRLSVLGNSEYPHLGPPIVRLVHGILYENVRCIAEDYSIQVDDKNGYDLKTMLPQVLRVQLKLKEVRISEKGFEPLKKPDNLIGWNDILEKGYTTLNGLGREGSY